MSKTLLDNLANILNQKNTYLTPNNIKNGVQIFDIVGTYTGESENGVKLFDTVANMQNDSNAQLNDLAIVYNNASNNFNGLYQYDYVEDTSYLSLPTFDDIPQLPSDRRTYSD